MSKLSLVLLAALSVVGVNATASTTSGKAAEKKFVDVSSAFEQQKKAIEIDLADGETYSEISSKDRDLVKTALQRISNALASAGGVDALLDGKKAEVFNDQELVNNILTNAGEDSRLVCTREKKVGSHRTTTRCETVAQRRRAAEESQKAMRENQRVMMPRPGG